MTVEARLALDFTARQVGAADLGNPDVTPALSWVRNYLNGVGVAAADKLFTDVRTLAASATESLDLSAGALTDPFGSVVTFAQVKAMIVRAADGNTNNVLVGGAASNAWATWAGDVTDVISVKPGGIFAIAAPGATGFPVTATTADLLKITNSGAGTSVTYTIVLLGASA